MCGCRVRLTVVRLVDIGPIKLFRRPADRLCRLQVEPQPLQRAANEGTQGELSLYQRVLTRAKFAANHTAITRDDRCTLGNFVDRCTRAINLWVQDHEGADPQTGADHAELRIVGEPEFREVKPREYEFKVRLRVSLRRCKARVVG